MTEENRACKENLARNLILRERERETREGEATNHINPVIRVIYLKGL